ncbi:MAG: SPOR domain-containing protein [Pseudomonadota bacterium]
MGTVPRAPERANTQAETTGLPTDTQPGDAASELAQSQPEAPAKILGGTKFAPGLSPVAPRRPADLQTRVAQATRAVREEAVNLSSRAAASRVQIQLAADPSETAVRDIWRRVSRANSDILRDRALAIQSTISGGTTYYRLRVGPFRDGTEARAVCAALKARGQDCIVARNG